MLLLVRDPRIRSCSPEQDIDFRLCVLVIITTTPTTTTITTITITTNITTITITLITTYSQNHHHQNVQVQQLLSGGSRTQLVHTSPTWLSLFAVSSSSQPEQKHDICLNHFLNSLQWPKVSKKNTVHCLENDNPSNLIETQRLAYNWWSIGSLCHRVHTDS